MNRIKMWSVMIIGFSVATSCVSSKKFKTIKTQYLELQRDASNCQDQLKTAQLNNSKLTTDNAALQRLVDELKSQVKDLKTNTSQMLSTLQDLSVMSGKQAESVKKSLETINEKDFYIKGLQAAMNRKDSLNLVLVTNLKSVLNNVNDNDVNIKVEKGVIYVDISDKMLFNSGKYEVTRQAKSVLEKIARVLNAHPDFDFMVEGHTDSVPINTDCMADNWDLSVKRATSVIRLLQNQYHISPSRMTAAGHAEFVPVASNNNAADRALNRRTRIIILPQLDQFFNLLTTKSKS